MINKDIININNVKRIEAGVKWYNPEKGYGFLHGEDSLSDIMIHFSTLDRIGCPYVKIGDHVICDVASGKSGLYVVCVIEVKFGSSEQRSLTSYLSSRLNSSELDTLKEVEGTLKWYNPDKKYGFICPKDGSEEIFIHYSVVREAGYKSLEPGIQVLAKVSHSERGKEAKMIRILREAEEKTKEAI